MIAKQLRAVASAGQRGASALGAAAGSSVRVGAEAMRLLGDVGPERKRRVVWSQRGNAAIEVRGLPGRGRAHRAMSDELRAALGDLRGVRWADVNAVTAQVLIAFDEDEVGVGELVDAVEAVEEGHGTAGSGFAWQREIHPADSAPLAAAYTALAADLAGVSAGLAGWIFRVMPLHPATRVPFAIMESYPRLRGILERRIGPIGADLALSVGNAVVFGLSDGPAKPAVEACHQLLIAAEVRARREAWSRRGPELSRQGGALPGKRPKHAGRPRPLPPGPVETYADRAAFGSLLAAAGVLGLTSQPGRAADVIVAGLPRSAALGRDGFSATLGGELARQGIMPMDPNAYRRLDRVSAIIVDSAALCADQPLVLSASAAKRDGDDAVVWQAASGVLRGLSVDDLRGSGPWHDGGYVLARKAGSKQPGQAGKLGPRSPQGLRLSLTSRAGDRLGTVVVGCELDPLAEAVLGAARAGGARLLLTRHASAQGLVARADEIIDEPASRIGALAAGGEGVLLVGETDGAALSAADVSVSCVRDGQGVGWCADLLCEGGLAGVWRVLTAAGRARGVSDRAVTLSLSGSALGVLLAAVGSPASRGRPGSPGEVANPMAVAGLANLIQGAHAARAVARAALPAPWPRTPWHALDAADVLARLDAAADQSTAADGGAAVQAGSRQERLPGAGLLVPLAAPLRFGGELAATVFDELRDPLTPVLVIGAAAAAVLGSGTDAVLVGGVMVGNALVSGIQRLRTEHELRELLLAERQPARRVRRKPGDPLPDEAGQAEADTMAASELRVGDVVALRSDDVVPADVRLLVAEELEVDESALTGESMPVSKDPAPAIASQVADRSSMLYEGTTVLAGTALGVVVATGQATEAGQASAAAAGAPRAAGVQARLTELTRIALPVTGIGGLVVTGLGLVRGVQLRQALTAGVAVAVAAVPEGLPLVSTVAQLAAARRLSRQGVLVRSPRTLEALGRVDVLCFDKTGTLTEGRLHLVAAAAPDGVVDLATAQGQQLVRVAARACPRPGEQQVHATDQAIRAAAPGEDPEWEFVREIPFQASRGYSASLGRTGDGAELAVKGTPEVLLERCSRVCSLGEDGSAVARPLTKQRRRAAKSAVDGLAADGLRVIAVAQRPTAMPSGDEVPPLTELVCDLTLVGFVGIADVMRPDATQIVAALADAGVRTVMITGDHPATAAAIARAAGMSGVGRVLLGDELDTMAEAERRDMVDGCAVFARVSPQQKVRIVADLQRAGHVVAMTGDGTNDAAAIRLADVGIGVSARGSTAARSASDLILTTSNLSEVADALAEGRALWRNVADALSILLGGNVGEIAFMIAGTALGGRSPLNTRQLLLVNMLTDMFPALAVAVGQPNGDEDLSTGPVGQVLGEPLARAIAVRGGATALGATLAWAGGRLTGRRRRAATMGLAAVISTQLAQTLLSNASSPVVILTTAASGGVLMLVVSTPGVSQFFGSTPLGPVAWMIVAMSTATAIAASAAASHFSAIGSSP